MYEQSYRQLQRSFAAYTMYIKAHVEKGLFVHCRVFGSFTQLRVLDGSQSTKVCYMPCAETLVQLGVGYQARAPCNMPCEPLDSLAVDVHRVNYQQIAASVDLTESALVQILKLVLSVIDALLNKNDAVLKLNLKLGFLKFKNKSV